MALDAESSAPSPDQIAAQVAIALAEDIGSGDRSAALIAPTAYAQAQVICREAAVICGRAWFDAVFAAIDPTITIEWQVEDGQLVAANQPLCQLHGHATALLTGERTALNFLQSLSATATAARRYVDAVAGSGCTILDTRKTIPGLRLAQKYAVRCGGASNHRIGLYDGILIKENHIAAAGSIAAAVAAAQQQALPGMLLEVEVERLDQLQQALDVGVERILLDNMSLDQLRAAVALTAGRAKLEASGGVALEQLAALAATGVDYISVGSITKHLQAIDLSMRFQLAPTAAAEG